MSSTETDELPLPDMKPQWVALQMIRDAIEELGPPGALASEETVLRRYGPEPVHEAAAIVDALRELLGARGA